MLLGHVVTVFVLNASHVVKVIHLFDVSYARRWFVSCLEYTCKNANRNKIAGMETQKNSDIWRFDPSGFEKEQAR
jgi:hypothetical protein